LSEGGRPWRHYRPHSSVRQSVARARRSPQLVTIEPWAKLAPDPRMTPLTLALAPGTGMKSGDIEEMFRRFAAVNPNLRGELYYINPDTLLVAVALSAQATDAGVNKATRPLFEAVTTPAQMVALGEEGLKEYIRSIGLFNTKAKNIIKLSQMLLDEHGGEVPADAAALERLPGVGQKTAKVVLNIAFGVPVIAVDTHIFR